MKLALFAAALVIGGSALAQTTSPAGGEDPAIAGTQSQAPSNANPETDARGVRVMSAAAEVPEGANQAPPAGPAVPAPNQSAVFTPRPAAEEYPVCSRTVTDNCVQAYERGVRRPG